MKNSNKLLEFWGDGVKAPEDAKPFRFRRSVSPNLERATFAIGNSESLLTAEDVKTIADHIFATVNADFSVPRGLVMMHPIQAEALIRAEEESGKIEQL